jgi:hypothetical protein
MRRRRRTSVPPERLVAFDPDDGWPRSPPEAFERWLDSRRAWAEEHDGWPGLDPDPVGIDAMRQRPDEPWNPDAV